MAQHSTARRARREGLANKPVQGGGRREARVMPLPKMLLLLTDGAAESLEPRSIPAPGAPPAPQHSQPSTAALPGAHSLTHGPGDGAVLSGSPSQRGCGCSSQPQSAGREPSSTSG